MRKYIAALLISLVAGATAAESSVTLAPFTATLRSAAVIADRAHSLIRYASCEDLRAYGESVHQKAAVIPIEAELSNLELIAESLRVLSKGELRDSAMAVRALVLAFRNEAIDALNVKLRQCGIPSRPDNGVEK